jgi:hypothetical protein
VLSSGKSAETAKDPHGREGSEPKYSRSRGHIFPNVTAYVVWVPATGYRMCPPREGSTAARRGRKAHASLRELAGLP